jgi:hypothetical protein
MPLLNRRSRTRLPLDLLAQREQLGRASYDPESYESPWQLTVAMYRLVQENRDGFLADWPAATLSVGGWLVYGAIRLVMDILDPSLTKRSST